MVSWPAVVTAVLCLIVIALVLLSETANDAQYLGEAVPLALVAVAMSILSLRDRGE